MNAQLNQFSDRLSNTISNFDDPETVKEALPTLLLVLDSTASGEGASGEIKLSAAKLYSAYSGAFVNNLQRQQVLSARALTYAQQGVCQINKHWCAIEQMNNADFARFIQTIDKPQVPLAYAYASTLLGYIQAHSDDWATVAKLNRAKSLLDLVVSFDPAYDHAGAHLYLGALAMLLPPAAGGKADVGKQHFETALALTHGQNLMVKVEYARRYAKALFDQALYHQLLTEVMQADANVPGLVLMNTIAKQQAKALLADEQNYFD